MFPYILNSIIKVLILPSYIGLIRLLMPNGGVIFSFMCLGTFLANAVGNVLISEEAYSILPSGSIDYGKSESSPLSSDSDDLSSLDPQKSSHDILNDIVSSDYYSTLHYLVQQSMIELFENGRSCVEWPTNLEDSSIISVNFDSLLKSSNNDPRILYVYAFSFD